MMKSRRNGVAAGAGILLLAGLAVALWVWQPSAPRRGGVADPAAPPPESASGDNTAAVGPSADEADPGSEREQGPRGFGGAADDGDETGVAEYEFWVNGLVVAEGAGYGVEGATVAAELEPDETGAELPTVKLDGTARTDADGFFVLKGRASLPEGGADRVRIRFAATEERLGVGFSASWLLSGMARPAATEREPGSPLNVGKIVLSGARAALRGRIVDGATGGGIEGALVTLQVEAGKPPATNTGASGAFVFEETPVGRFGLFVSHEGYVRLYTPNYLLTPGDDLDVGDIALCRPIALCGRVVDEEGNPVRAEVVIDSGVGAYGDTQFSSFSGSGDDGVFVSSEDYFPPGVYRITVRPDASKYLARRVVVEVAGGESRDLGDIVVSAGVAVSGIVVDGRGDPVPGAFVCWGLERLEPEIYSHVVSGEDGTFHISGLIPEAWTVTVWSAGHASRTFEYRLEAGEENYLEIVLSAGGVVKGSLPADAESSQEGLLAVLIPHSSQAYADYRRNPEVSPRQPYYEKIDDWENEVIPSALVRPGESFEISRIEEGDYLLLLLAVRDCSEAPEGDLLGNHYNINRVPVLALDDIQVPDGGVVDVGELAAGWLGTLCVKVETGGIERIADESIGIFPWLENPDAYLEDSFDTWDSVIWASLDDDGYTDAIKLPPGSWLVIYGCGEDMEASRWGRYDREWFNRRKVVVSEGEVVNFVLDEAPANRAVLEGRLTGNGIPLFFRVELTGTQEQQGFFRGARVEESGAFRMGDVPEGTFVLSAQSYDLDVPARMVVKVDAAGRVAVRKDFRLHHVSGEVAGVDDLAGRAQVRVHWRGEFESRGRDAYGGGEPAVVSCDERGRFRIFFVAEGDYLLEAEMEGARAAQAEIRVDDNLEGLVLVLYRSD